jgi:hypothetical protein
MVAEGLLIKDAAKQLQIGSKTLYALLHQKGFIAPGTNYPRDEMVKAGYFKTQQRDCTIKRAGESGGLTKHYYVTLVTPEGLKFLQPIVDNHKAAIAPAPGRIKVYVDIQPSIAHALVRYATLIEKDIAAMSEEERAELSRASSFLEQQLPPITSLSVERNKKLFSHPKFKTAFRPQQQQQSH